MSKKKKKRKKKQPKHLPTLLDKQIKNFVCQCKCTHCDAVWKDKLGPSYCPTNPIKHHWINWVNFDEWTDLYTRWKLQNLN